MTDMHKITTATTVTTDMVNELEMALMAAKKSGEVVAFLVPYSEGHTQGLTAEQVLVDRLRERGLTIKVTPRRADNGLSCWSLRTQRRSRIGSAVMRRLLPLVAFIVLLPVPMSAGAATRKCGSINADVAPYDILATGTTCRTARSVARVTGLNDLRGGCVRYEEARIAFRSCSRLGWKCGISYRYSAYFFRVRCTRGERSIKYKLGSS